MRLLVPIAFVVLCGCATQVGDSFWVRTDGGLLNSQQFEADRAACAIPTIPISRSSGSRSVIPIDPDQTGVSAPLDAFADLRVCGSGQA
jgi:hypothetical protein